MNLSRGLMNDLDTRSLIQNNVSGRCRLSLHLVPTKRKRPDNRGKFSTSALQGRCSLCRYKTTWRSSKCEDDENLGKTILMCNPKSKRMCFVTHVEI